jgi:hypothetical protein
MSNPVTLESLARHLAQMNALATACLAAIVSDDAPKLDVFAGRRAADTQPLWCVFCGARYSQDCTCPKYEIEPEDQV